MHALQCKLTNTTAAAALAYTTHISSGTTEQTSLRVFTLITNNKSKGSKDSSFHIKAKGKILLGGPRFETGLDWTGPTGPTEPAAAAAKQTNKRIIPLFAHIHCGKRKRRGGRGRPLPPSNWV